MAKNTEEYPIIEGCFEYNGKTYDCRPAIERDIQLIIQEAETSHKESFDKLYDRQSLKPNKVRIYLDEKDNPIFGIVIYLIAYKDGNGERYACGGYYPFITITFDTILLPHYFQTSICW